MSDGRHALPSKTAGGIRKKNILENGERFEEWGSPVQGRGSKNYCNIAKAKRVGV